MTASPNLFEVQARELAGRPEASMTALEVVDMPGLRGTKITLGDAPPLVKSGPNKGKPNYRSPLRNRIDVFISDADRAAFRSAWAAQHDVCIECLGESRRWTGWHYQTGDSFTPCVACGATGKPPARSPEGDT